MLCKGTKIYLQNICGPPFLIYTYTIIYTYTLYIMYTYTLYIIYTYTLYIIYSYPHLMTPPPPSRCRLVRV